MELDDSKCIEHFSVDHKIYKSKCAKCGKKTLNIDGSNWLEHLEDCVVAVVRKDPMEKKDLNSPSLADSAEFRTSKCFFYNYAWQTRANIMFFYTLHCTLYLTNHLSD